MDMCCDDVPSSSSSSSLKHTSLDDIESSTNYSKQVKVEDLTNAEGAEAETTFAENVDDDDEDENTANQSIVEYVDNSSTASHQEIILIEDLDNSGELNSSSDVINNTSDIMYFNAAVTDETGVVLDADAIPCTPASDSSSVALLNNSTCDSIQTQMQSLQEDNNLTVPSLADADIIQHETVDDLKSNDNVTLETEEMSSECSEGMFKSLT